MRIISILAILLAALTVDAQFSSGGSARVPRRQVYPWANFRVVFDGDSMTSRNGDAITDSEPNVATYVRLWHGMAAACTNIAVSDQDSGDMLGDVTTQVFPLMDSNKTYIVHPMIGSNDWHLDATPAGTAWANYSNYLWQCKNYGETSGVVVRVIACTMPMVGQSPPATAGFNTNFNNFVRAHWKVVAHTLSDLAADDRFDDNEDTTYYADDFHFNDTGIRIYAEHARVAIIKAALGGL